MKKLIAATTLGSLMLAAGLAQAADYQIDKQGQHASVNFKISHRNQRDRQHREC